MPLTSGFGGRGASRRGDSAVVAVLLAAGLWELTVAAFRPGEPSLPALLAFGCAAMYVAGAAAATVGRWAVPAGVVLVASVLSVVGRTTLFTALPHAGPLRYANASAAFFAISATAALALGWSFDNRAFRWTSIALAASLLSVCIAEHAVAATLAGITIPAIGLAVRNRLGPRAGVASLVCVGLLAVAAPIGAGIVYRPHDPASRAAAMLAPRAVSDLQVRQSRRLTLWHDAVRMAEQDALLGVGPGGFARRSPTALRDPDARWAHNGFLQQAAETGLPGLALLFAAFAAAWIRLWMAADADAVFGGAALTILAVTASVDYVMHFAVIPLAVAFLVGSAGRRSRVGIRSA